MSFLKEGIVELSATMCTVVLLDLNCNSETAVESLSRECRQNPLKEQNNVSTK